MNRGVDLVTLQTNERVNVKGIVEVKVVKHYGVKRRFNDVRYVPKFKRLLYLWIG